MFRDSRFALSLLAASLLAGPVLAAQQTQAHTQTQTGSTQVGKNPVSKPLSAWLVGPSLPSAFDAKEHPDEVGCLMVTEYDNGMILGIHAREKGIVGMTVDIKQQALVPGQESTLGVNVGTDSYAVQAVATDDSTLAINLADIGGGRRFVERLTELGNFRLLIDNKPYYFATTGFTDGLARLQACMGGNMAVPLVVTGPGVSRGRVTQDTGIEAMRVTSSGHDTPLALAMPNLVPSDYRFVLDNVDPMTPIDWQQGDDWVAVMRQALAPHSLKMSIKGETIRISKRTGPDEPDVEGVQAADQAAAQTPSDAPVVDRMQSPDSPVGVWAGAKGESLSDVLDTWGLMAGVNVKVDLAGDLRLPGDVKYEGRFDDAVRSLLSLYTGKNAPTARYQGEEMTPQPAPSAPAQPKKTVQQSPILAGDPAMTPMPAQRKVDMGMDAGETATQFPPKRVFKPRPIAEIMKDKPRAMSWSPLSQMAPVPDTAPAPKTKKAAKPKTGTWKALEGTSLRDALEHWGRDAGVKIVYLSEEPFPLPQAVKEKGTFEDAVAKTLARYKGQGVYPAAQLNRDPATGETALIIRTGK
ncbi:MAG: TcpQ domain-containing protein [Rhodospirillales bacterium]|nr:TcpQ domain-containing protein [Alphaproteobacteria bacterium]MCB9986128.1 TcpQ domain-containing protein [Rhodospirillales bacterium]USO07313.1 MAG: TcpQ domain-containing protein [Rhodospirillales bacterium]